MKRLFIIALGMLLSFPALTSASPSKAGGKFKVGAILPLSGRSADYGVAAKNGIELARTERPELLKNIEFNYDDSLYDGKTTITTFHRLRTSGKADVVFVWGHGPCEAVAAVAEAQKVPTIVVSGDYAVARGRNYVIRFFPIHERFGEALIQYIRSKGYKRVGIVKTELGFLNHVVDGIRKKLNPDELVELVDNYQLGDIDFRTTVAKLKSRDYDAVGVFLAENQVALFYQQAKEQEFHVPTFGSHSFASKKSVVEARGEMTGAVYPAMPVDPEFRDRYVARFGSDVQISFAANAYDFAILMGELFNDQVGRITNDQIVALLKAVRSQRGVTGKYGYLATPESGGGFEFSIVMREIQEDNSTRLVANNAEQM